jgi:hypothetical protein
MAYQLTMNLPAVVGERRLKLVEEGKTAGEDSQSAAIGDIDVIASPTFTHDEGTSASTPGARDAHVGDSSRPQTLLARGSASHGDPILTVCSVFYFIPTQSF